MPLCLISSLLSADISGIGRVDRDSIPDQARMELLLENVKNKGKLMDHFGNYSPIEFWDEIRLNDDGQVIEIWWLFGDFVSAGTIDLQWLPLGLERCTISECSLLGSVDTESLPRGMRYFNIRRNKLKSVFSIEGLPADIRFVNIGFNNFHGTLNLQSLPANITDFHVDFNVFSGSIDLGVLPNKLEYLGLNHNRFKQRQLLIGKIPETVKRINLQSNTIGCFVDDQQKEILGHELITT